MRKFVLACIVLPLGLSCFTAPESRAQYDPLYNQYQFDQSMINPAYAGALDVLRVGVFIRKQWVNIEGAPLTNTVTGHTSIANNTAGVGLLVINDQFGVNSNTEVYGSFSYKINFGRGTLSAGLSGGYLSYRYDYSKLNLEVPDDPAFTPVDETISQPNFGMGVFWMTENYYVGASIPRILAVDIEKDLGTGSPQTSDRYRRHIYLSGGGLVTLNATLKLKPFGLVRLVDGASANIDLGGSLIIRELIWAGLVVRNFDAIALQGQLEISDKVRAGLSVEIPTTKLVTNSYGTYEIMVLLDFAAFPTQVLKRKYF